MLSSLLHDDDDFEMNPGSINDRIAAPAANRPVRGNFTRRIGYQFEWWHVVVGVLVLFPYISIFVLFGLVGNQDHTTKNYYTTQQISSVSTFGQSTFPTSQVGVGLSFTSTGALQVGGGTSLYKNIVNILASCPSYLSMDNIGSQQYLLSYANKNTFNSTLQLVQMNAEEIDEATVEQILAVGYYVYELVTLSDTTGIFVAICQDFSASAEDSYVIAGKVANNQITVNSKNPVIYTSATDLYSVTPQIVALSETSFAIAYYSSKSAQTRYGTVDPTSLTVALSAPYYFANDSTNSTYFTLSPLTAETYMLFYYNSIYENGVAQPGLLHALQATVTNPASAPSASLTLSNTSVLETAFLSYYFAATTLDNSTVVVVYIDALGNNAVVAQIVRAMNLGTKEIVFGATWIVNGGASYEYLQTGVLDLDVQTISESREFVVLYSDISNGGAILATLGQLTETNELLRASPDFVLVGANPNTLETVTTWGAIAAGQTTSTNTQTAILVMQTTGDCDKIASASFAMLQRLPSPIGISTKADSSSSSSSSSDNNMAVAISGTVSGLSLSPGKVYYTNTKGELVASSSFAGHSNSMSIAGLNSQSPLYYLYDSGSNAYISLDSKVGIATSSDSLFVQTISS